MDEYINLHDFLVPTNSCGRKEVTNMRHKVKIETTKFAPRSLTTCHSQLQRFPVSCL